MFTTNVEKLKQPDITIKDDLYSLRKGPLFDGALEIPGVKTYLIHKAILSLSSEYFKTLFSGRFTQTGNIILKDVEPETVDLYLDLIYGANIKNNDWRAILKVLVFAKFTQTSIKNKDNIVVELQVPIEDFVEYVQQLSNLYDGEIPIDIIGKISIPPPSTNNGYNNYIGDIDFKSLGKDFVVALIETRTDELTKYLIAQKAASEDMGNDLYKLVLLNRLLEESNYIIKDLIASDSIPFLRQADKKLLTTIDDIIAGKELFLELQEDGGYAFNNYGLFNLWVCRTINQEKIIVAVQVPVPNDKRFIYSSFQNLRQINIRNATELTIGVYEQFKNGTAIKIKDYYYDNDLYEYILSGIDKDVYSNYRAVRDALAFIVIRDYEII